LRVPHLRPREVGSMAKFAPKEILCAVDLSPASTAVFSWARLIAEAFGAQVEVLHADWSEPPRYFTEGQISTLDSQAERQREMLERDLQDLGHKVLAPHISFTVSVVEGHAVDVILGRLRKDPPDLVVMGSHGRSGVARMLLGSVAENVVHEVHCPTLIVRGQEIPAGHRQLQRVLCPVDLTKMARECAELASEVASAFGTELCVLQTVENAVPDGGARRELCRWVPENVRNHCRVSEVVLKGDAAEQIILFARRENVDLIVMGAEHRSFLEFSTLGRTTERVLRHGPSSVLLVPHHPSDKSHEVNR
jgi:nucleotide-binding universal stress UspA family protein